MVFLVCVMNVAILTTVLCVDAPGLKKKIDALSQLKVKGLVVGPIHKAPKDNENELDLNSVAVAGSLTEFKALLDAAHKKSECLRCLPACSVDLSRPTSIISNNKHGLVMAAMVALVVWQRLL